MSEQDPTVGELQERLARFEEHAWRLSPRAAATVRAVLAARIEALGGTAPDGVDATAHPLHRAALVRAQAEGAFEQAPPDPPDAVEEMVEAPPERDFDFDRGATPHTPDLQPDRRSSQGATFDQENPRYEDFSQYELELDEEPPVLGAPPVSLGEADAESVAIPLDDVRPIEGNVRLVVHAGTDEERPMDLSASEEVSFGRGKSCTVRLKDARASRVHCRVFDANGIWSVEDLGSANGTTVSGATLKPRQPVPLAAGDEVVVGSTVVRFERIPEASVA